MTYPIVYYKEYVLPNFKFPKFFGVSKFRSVGILNKIKIWKMKVSQFQNYHVSQFQKPSVSLFKIAEYTFKIRTIQAPEFQTCWCAHAPNLTLLILEFLKMMLLQHIQGVVCIFKDTPAIYKGSKVQIRSTSEHFQKCQREDWNPPKPPFAIFTQY